MAKSKTTPKKKTSKASLNGESKGEKLKKLKEPKAAKAKPAKVKKEKSQPLNEFQNTKLTGRENGHAKEDPIVIRKAESVSKVKMLKSGECFIQIVKIESDQSTTEHTELHKGRTAHPDLKACFLNLRVHFGLLFEMISTQQLKNIESYNPDIVEKFVVTSIGIKQKNGSDGYIISGYKLLSSGNATPGFSTRCTMVDESDETRYRYMDDLVEKVSELLAEIKLYQSGEKIGQAVQQEFEFEGAEEDENDPNQLGIFDTDEDKPGGVQAEEVTEVDDTDHSESDDE